MGAAAISAAKGTLRQVRALWHGWPWSKIGSTPMIGQNDSPEALTRDHATAVAAFARSVNVGRLAFWSVNRDRACVSPSAVTHSDCSGLSQDPFDYTDAFVAYQTG